MKFGVARKPEADPYAGVSCGSGHRSDVVIEPGCSQEGTFTMVRGDLMDSRV